MRGTDISITLLDLAIRVRTLRDLPPDLPATLDSTGEFTAPGLHHPNGSHVCEVEIDPEAARDKRRADRGGIFNLLAEPGDLVYAGDELGVISNPFGRELKRPWFDVATFGLFAAKGVSIGIATDMSLSFGGLAMRP